MAQLVKVLAIKPAELNPQNPQDKRTNDLHMHTVERACVQTQIINQ